MKRMSILSGLVLCAVFGRGTGAAQDLAGGSARPAAERVGGAATDREGSTRPAPPLGDAETLAPPRLRLPAPGWPNSGGNSARNGFSPVVGPEFFDPLWRTPDPSLVSWEPVIDGGRVFVVRQHAAPGNRRDALVVALDLDTGEELWTRLLPGRRGDWTPWIAGARDGRVYASRAGNDHAVAAPILALDAATGVTVWLSEDQVDAGPYDGAVFARNGDLLVGEKDDVRRIDARDGTTVWTTRRACPDGPCGVALSGDAVYATDFSGDGVRVVRLDAGTGTEVHHSAPLDASSAENTPMVGPDGTVYLVQGGRFWALADLHRGFRPRWSVPAGPVVDAQSGAVGPDGTIYIVGPGPELRRLDPATGATLDASAALATGAEILAGARIAIDRAGHVFFSGGNADPDGRLYAFAADLKPLWDAPAPRADIGGPVLGGDGTLVMSDGTAVRAYRRDPCDDGRCRVHRIAEGRCVPGYFCDDLVSVGQGQAGWIAFDIRKLEGLAVCGVALGFTQTATANGSAWPIDVGVYDVSTPFEELNQIRNPIDATGAAIAQDLSTGAVYETLRLHAEDEGRVLRFGLEGLAASDLQRAADHENGVFSVGLANPGFDALGYFSPQDGFLEVSVCEGAGAGRASRPPAAAPSRAPAVQAGPPGPSRP